MTILTEKQIRMECHMNGIREERARILKVLDEELKDFRGRKTNIGMPELVSSQLEGIILGMLFIKQKIEEK